MIENYEDEISIRIGKESDGLEKLEQLCREEANKLIKTTMMHGNTTVAVPFWTDECFSELICVGYFEKDENGNITYRLDFSESTL
jgi:hypothetical protein